MEQLGQFSCVGYPVPMYSFGGNQMFTNYCQPNLSAPAVTFSTMPQFVPDYYSAGPCQAPQCTSYQQMVPVEACFGVPHVQQGLQYSSPPNHELIPVQYMQTLPQYSQSTVDAQCYPLMQTAVISPSSSFFATPQQGQLFRAESSTSTSDVIEMNKPETTPLRGKPAERKSAKKPITYRNNILFKTELCQDFQRYNRCPRGTRCQFAHGPQDLHEPSVHPLYKTAFCAEFKASGICEKGVFCFHVHSPDELRRRASRSSFRTAPRFQRHSTSSGGSRASSTSGDN